MVSIKLNKKPLSVNQAWQGKRFKTNKYKAYEKELLYTLPKLPLPYQNKKLKISFVFGFSSPLSDLDNPVKMLLDILQKKYRFNDKEVFELNVKKEIVKKKAEFIKIEISTLN